jgi:hypothetical protein
VCGYLRMVSRRKLAQLLTRRFINFASATPQETDQFVCNLTTFNRGNDVYDKSDRKAGAMDPSNFSAQFDPVRTGLIKIIEGRLLHGDKEKMYIRAEVHQLNVHGDLQCFLCGFPGPSDLNPRTCRQRFVLQGTRECSARQCVRFARGRLSDPTRRRPTCDPLQGPRVDFRCGLFDIPTGLSFPGIRRVLRRH